MRSENDWRLGNQLKYLKGAVLHWRQYRAPSPSWDHDHCAFCWEKFLASVEGTLKEGYASDDEYHWICKTCFEDFQDLFEWRIKDV